MPSRKTIAAKANAPHLPDNITIRPYDPKDWDEVCRLFWKGVCVGEDAALSIGLRNMHLRPLPVVAYYLFATGAAIVYFRPGMLVDNDLDPVYVGGALAFVAVVAVIFLRSRFRKTTWAGCKAAWRGDMKDLDKYYAFQKEVGVKSGWAYQDGETDTAITDRPLGDDGGFSGFWVAEAVEKVKVGKGDDEVEEKRVLVGCIGLDSRTSSNKSVSEIRRLTVLPLEKYRKKGIGKALLHEALTYAKKHRPQANKTSEKGLTRLTARLTTLQPAAYQLFKKAGWKVTDTKAFGDDGSIWTLWGLGGVGGWEYVMHYDLLEKA